MPADHLDIRHLGIELIPVLGLGHGLQVHLDIDFGQHGDNRFGNFFIIHITVVGSDHGAFKPFGQTGGLHQFFGLFQVIAG